MSTLSLVKYDGYTWYRTSHGYYQRKKPTYKMLHIYKWEKYRGPISQGYEIHHRDEDKANNRLSNLQLLTKAAHRKLHHKGKSISPEQIAKAVAANTGRVWTKEMRAKAAQSRKVRCVETGEVFDTITQAAESVGRHINTVSRCVLGTLQTSGGYHWEYADTKGVKND